MHVVGTYQTKAKWALGVRDGFPIGGYYTDGEPYTYLSDPDYTMHAPGENFLMHGSLLVNGTGRGRSAAWFNMQTVCGLGWTMAPTGMVDVINAVARGYVALTERDGVGCLTGFWTFAKRGTEVSVIPAPRAVIRTFDCTFQA